MDIEETRQAYLRALSPQTDDDIRKENEQLKAELNALRNQHDRILTALQNSVDSVLRIAREGKSDT